MERPVTVMVSAVLVVLAGAWAVFDLPIQLTPDISLPTLTVDTWWAGASPSEVERQIVLRQEDVLKDVPGLVRMTSSASPSRARVTLELEVGTDMDDALVRVTNRLTQVTGYPDNADEPTVATADDTGPPLAVLAVHARDGGSVAAYRTWVAETILPELSRVPGVGEVSLVGGQDTVFLIEFDPRELAARGIAVPDLADRLRQELTDISAGDMTLGRRRVLVRTMAVDPDPAEIAQIVLRAGPDGTPVRLGDVAEVSLGLRDPAGVALSDGQPALVMFIQREAGSNVLAVTEAVRARVETLDRDVLAPEGLEFEVVSDQVEYIQSSLDAVQENLLLGALLAIITLLLFLRSIGPSAIVSLSIPISVFATTLGMSLLGRSLNVISLAGITFAVGMLLDNSIVSLESIETWRARVSDPKEAAYLGIKEVWGALLASTATTAAVFIPVIGWQSEVGQLLRDVAVAISVSVIASLAVSVWVIPGLAGYVLRARAPAKKAAERSIGTRLRVGVGDLAAYVSRSIPRSLFVLVSSVVGCTVFAWWMLPPVEYLPSGNRNLVFASLVPPPGASVAELERVGERMQRELTPHIGREVDGVPAIGRSFFMGSPERVFVGTTAADPARVDELAAWMRASNEQIPGFISFTSQASLFGRSSSGRSIEVNLTGTDLDTLTRVGAVMFARLRDEIPGAQVRPVPSLDGGARELHAFPRRGDAAPLGVTTRALGVTLDALVDGAVIGELGRDGEPQVDVMLRAERIDGTRVDDPDDIRSAPVVAPGGEVVTFGVLADLREELGPTILRRIERRRAITLIVSPPDEVPLASALEIIEDDVIAPLRRDGTIPSELAIEYSGTAGDLEVARDDFINVLLLAVLICYLLMAALFEDLLAPIVVLVTVPLAAAGGIGALRLVDAFIGAQPLDLLTGMGFLILIGTVVNNAILVVDGAIARFREGDDLEAAVRVGVESRVRPIMMTTLTSLAGLLPMVILPGTGTELYRGIGAVLLGGLTISTVLTLVVVPAFFTLVWRARARFRRDVPVSPVQPAE